MTPQPQIKQSAHITGRELDKVRKAVETYIDFIQDVESGAEHEDSVENCEREVLEKVIEMFCGEGVWDEFVNKILV